VYKQCYALLIHRGRYQTYIETEKTMKKKYYLITIILIVGILFISCNQANEFQSEKSKFTNLEGPYLGQKPPGMQAEIFAPNIISTQFNEHICSFTPDGKEVYFRIMGPPRGGIYFMKEENGKWTKPEVASFLGNYDAKCALSPDGNKMVFSSGMPAKRKGKSLDHWEIWIVERTGNDWGEPVNIGLKPDYDVACPTIANSGNIYYYSESISNGLGNGDIYMSKYEDGKYSKPINLGGPINTEFWENDPFIAPDESYLIFQSDREGDHEFGDLFISYKNKDGKWIKPINMGENVNASYSGEGCPMVSPDGKYLFFSGMKINFKKYINEPISYTDKMRILNNPGNGSEDIYWVDAKIIEKLRPNNLSR